MQDVIVAIVVAVFASTGFWQVVNTIIAKDKDEKTVERRALKALLHDKLYYLCEKHIEMGEITADEYENIQYLYDPYAALHGNGTCERLMNEVKKLPIKKKEGK